MPLRADLAERACRDVGRRIGLDPQEAAWGIRQIALEEMVKAVRSLVVDRGLDPRAHTLLSYGGAGSLFVTEIARAIGSPHVLVPELAPVLSAFGCAATDVVRERTRSLLIPILDSPNLVQSVAEALRDEVSDDLGSDRIQARDRTVEIEADLRFSRQMWELTAPITDWPIDAAALEQLEKEFRVQYARVYGSGVIMDAATVELVNVRARGTGRTVRASVPRRRRVVTEGTAAPQFGSRHVRLTRGADGVANVPIFLDSALLVGHTLAGPAIVDAGDTTIWVTSGSVLHVDEAGTRVIELIG
jgi:N-methylhydantoinase A